MPLTAVLALINAASAVVKALGPLIAQAPEIFGSSDAEKIRSAADDLIAASDSIHQRVQDKLRGS